MRILVVGAGAVGGYFGARLAQAGRDVTFNDEWAGGARWLSAAGVLALGVRQTFRLLARY
jgi:2-dehydropantoate 2-reductase